MRKVIEMVDVLICGRFINEYKCEDTTKMYGSENQYIVDVKASLSTNTTVYLEKGNCFQNLEQLFNDSKYSKTSQKDG